MVQVSLDQFSLFTFWICCDLCKRWFHGKCVKITPAKAGAATRNHDLDSSFTHPAQIYLFPFAMQHIICSMFWISARDLDVQSWLLCVGKILALLWFLTLSLEPYCRVFSLQKVHCRLIILFMCDDYPLSTHYQVHDFTFTNLLCI